MDPGDPITAVGSPFGVISPPHFANSVVHGVISNHFPSGRAGDKCGSHDLLMADMRCLPGMEGGPVLNQQGHLVAIMLLPLMSNTFNAEVSFTLSSCLRDTLLNVCVGKESLMLLIYLICASTWETAAEAAKQIVYLGLHKVTYVGFSSS